MIHLADAFLSDPPGIVQIKEIAARERIPGKFLEQILLALKNAGLLHSRMGVGGGYHLSRSPDQINLGQIVRVLDGSLAPVKCVSHVAYEHCDCPDENICGLRMAMGDVRNAIADVLDNTTLEAVIRRMAAARLMTLVG